MVRTRHEPVDVQQAVRHLRRVDVGLRQLISSYGAPELSRSRNSFRSLGRAILYQQLHGKAAASIYRRVLDLYGGRFPAPEVLAEESIDRLRSAGVSRQKAAYLIDLASHYQRGLITPRRFVHMDNAAIAQQLTGVKGIGQWSVDMFLIFGLLRADVLPLGDYGVRMGMKKFFSLSGEPRPSVLEEAANHWRPFRSVACWYMWRVHEAAS